MRVARIALHVLIFSFFVSNVVCARDIGLPDAVGARAFVLETAKGGLWEKTLVVRFPERRRLLSTNDGFADVPVAVNHSAHPTLWTQDAVKAKDGRTDGGRGYEAEAGHTIAAGLGLKRKDMAMMSTAADMDNLAMVTRSHAPFVVVALVTAGAKTNALRAGVDEGSYIEKAPASGEVRKAPSTGTVNIMLLVNARLTDGAMARAIITATEAKTAAFEDLHVPSSYHPGVQATGTGTDSMIVVSGTSGEPLTYTGGHGKVGELIGKAVYEAVVEALGRQNGFRKPPRTEKTWPPEGPDASGAGRR